MCVYEEREREQTSRQTDKTDRPDRQTKRDRRTEIRQTERENSRQTERETDRHNSRETAHRPDRRDDRHRQTETRDRRTDKDTTERERKTDRTDRRQTEREKIIRLLYQSRINQKNLSNPVSNNINEEWANINEIITQAAAEAIGSRKKKSCKRGLRFWNGRRGARSQEVSLCGCACGAARWLAVCADRPALRPELDGQPVGPAGCCALILYHHATGRPLGVG
ncbi:Protein of unknown function [Gryllus bimaculatus]|nr:Protein of unknown function [Gryllus bimaculatus]